MKVESKFYKISISETLKLLLFMLIVTNGFICLFAVLIGKSIYLLDEAYFWVMQIAYPILYSLIHSSINRNGVLILTEYDDKNILLEQIESLILNRGYIRPNTTTNDITYVRKSKWAKFFNQFYSDNIKIRTNENEVLIFSKKNRLVPLVLKFRFEKR